MFSKNSIAPTNQIDNANFRLDINFLRFVAVMVVFINHINPSLLPAGFLGVDLFFVISGFVISNLLFKEYQNTHKINLLNFYHRRIYRIGPALCLLLLANLALGNLLIYAGDLRGISQASSYASYGFANQYFFEFLKVDYFNPTTVLEPILHLWSLGVEEQFYFIFPLLVFGFFRFKKVFLLGMVILAIISINLALDQSNKKATFYLLKYRAFELLAGVIASYIANYLFNKPTNHHGKHKAKAKLPANFKLNIHNNLFLAINLVLYAIIFSAFYMLNEKLAMPNLYSLYIVIPSMLLLILGSAFNINPDINAKPNPLNKIYALLPIKTIGLSSYSIYLWHWLILSYSRRILGNNLSFTASIMVFFTSILVGIVSYYLIEEKLRHKKNSWHSLILGLLLFVGVPYGLSHLSFKNATATHIKNAKNIPIFPSIYLVYNDKEFKQSTYNRLIPKNDFGTKPNIIFVGDSYADQNAYFLKTVAQHVGFTYDRRTMDGGGRFLLQDRTDPPNFYQSKYAMSDDILKYDVIIIGHRNTSDNDEINLSDLQKTLDYFTSKGKTIVLMGDIATLYQLDLNSIINNSLNNYNYLDKKHFNKVLGINARLENLAKTYSNVYYFDYIDLMLDKKKQLIYKDKVRSLFFNKDHLSAYGSYYFGNKYVANGIDTFWFNILKLYKSNKDESLEAIKVDE